MFAHRQKQPALPGSIGARIGPASGREDPLLLRPPTITLQPTPEPHGPDVNRALEQKSGLSYDFSRIPLHPPLAETIVAAELEQDRRHSAGQLLDRATRSYMEAQFHHDFGQIRVHTDATAVAVNQRLNANAFTIGKDIFFDSGQYAPGTRKGRSLLAHELTHTVQGEKHPSRKKWSVGNLDAPAEREAESVANTFMLTGGPVQVLQGASAMVHCQKKRTKTDEDKKDSKASKRDAYLRELATWPQQAHQAWKQLSEGEKLAVELMMNRNYGNDFVQEFLKYTRSGPKILTNFYNNNFPEHTPQWFADRHYKFVQRDRVVDRYHDIGNEYWVHPSGTDIVQVVGTVKPPEPVKECTKDLTDVAIQMAKQFASDAEVEQSSLTADKAVLEKNRDQSLYDHYVTSLNDLSNTVDADIRSLDDMRLSMTDSGCDTSAFDTEAQRLQDVRFWLDFENNPETLRWLKPINVQPKQSPNTP